MDRFGKRIGRFRRLLRQRGIKGLLHRLVFGRAGPSYAAWLAAHRLTDEDRRQIAEHIASWLEPPLISVLLPVHNNRPAWLRACLDSVLDQLYPHWELCIAEHASTNPRMGAILEEYAANDPRIKLVASPGNGRIAAAANSALKSATGGFVVFLDPSDLLSEHALYLVVTAILDHPDATILYSDSDCCDKRGRRRNPSFKPGWSPDLLRTHNYINQPTIMRTDLVRAVGGMRAELRAAQDYDLLMRVSERVHASTIHHIPHVLYHRRDYPDSTGSGADRRTESSRASRQVIQDCLARQGLAAEMLTTAAHPFLHQVRYRLPDPPPLVSVIIPTRDRLDLLKVCVEGLRRTTDYPTLELIIVDNDSREPEFLAYLQELSRLPDIQILRREGAFNYAALNNAGAALSRGEILCFLNNDVVITQPGWLRELTAQALRPEIGAVGPLLRYRDGRVQQAGIILGTDLLCRLAFHQSNGNPPPSPFQLQQTRNVTALIGACLVMRRSIYQEMDGLDEALAVTYNEVDLCLKLRAAGYWLLFTPFSELIHLGSASRGQENTPEKQARFQREADYLRARWGAFAVSDPFTNPNLDWRSERPKLAIPSAAARPWQRSRRSK